MICYERSCWRSQYYYQTSRWEFLYDFFRYDYLSKAGNHIKDNFTYEEVNFLDEDFVKLVDESNQVFKRLLNAKKTSTEELKYFSYNF